MPSPAGKTDARDRNRTLWSAATVGVPAVTLSQVGSACATLILKAYLPDADVEIQQAVNTLAMGVVVGLALGGGLLAEWLRLRFTDTRGT